MIFYDPKYPNKYSNLKKSIIPSKLDSLKKKKIGSGDGGYVLVDDFLTEDSRVLSYGIGGDPKGVSFEREIQNIGCLLNMYDGSIDQPPLKIEATSKFFKEFLTADNFKYHCDSFSSEEKKKNILKIDVEGCEYDWLTEDNLEIISKKFGQVILEVHSLIEEIPEGWVLEPEMIEAKKDRAKVERFFHLMNSKFHLFHIHGNNHAPSYVDFPDSMELTYVNKDCSTFSEVDYSEFPIEGLDEPNYDSKPDYVLNWWH